MAQVFLSQGGVGTMVTMGQIFFFFNFLGNFNGPEKVANTNLRWKKILNQILAQ